MSVEGETDDEYGRTLDVKIQKHRCLGWCREYRAGNIGRRRHHGELVEGSKGPAKEGTRLRKGFKKRSNLNTRS